MADLTPAQRKSVVEYLHSLPGKRGHDIPEHIHDVITQVGNGIAKPLYGRDLDPFQIQALYEGGYHTPEAIHEAMNSLPHPHAPNVTVGEYPDYAHAHKVFKEHS